MKAFHGRAAARVECTPRTAFDLVTDIDRLPDWNASIEALVERPPQLTPGAEWTVRMHPPHLPTWLSISRLEELDTGRLRFAYDTRNADGNPSHVIWSWDVVAAEGGAEVTVTWDCFLETFDRRFLGGPLRKRQLAREVPNSLAALGDALSRTSLQ